MTYAVSAVAAIIAGLCMAAAGVLQQRAASSRPSGERMSLRLMKSLVTDRTWLLGITGAVLSYVFQAVALAFGPLALVQPLIVSELLFAVPVSVRLRGLRLRLRDWMWVGSVTLGLAIGIVAADPQRGNPLPPFTTWLPALIAVAVIAAGSVLIARKVSGPPKASLFALAGACVMGLQSALYAATIELLRQDIAQTFLTWQPYALIVASFTGLFLIQNAYQSGPVATSAPVIDAILPLVSIGLGVAMFKEGVRTTPLGLTGAGVGIVLLITGIVGLDTSPVVRKEQRIEQNEQRKTEERERDPSGSAQENG
jgi:drug/metabolite transporter (DMT)-like permease